MKVIFLLLLSILACAKMLEVGERVTVKTLTSQHEQAFKLVEDGFWIVTWDKESTALVNNYFYKHKIKENCNMIVDVSQVPSGIFSMFVAPKMRRYNHPILLSFDADYNLSLPFKDGYITVLKLKDGSIEAIYYLEDQEELKELL